MTYTQRVDKGGRTYLAICSCGWRALHLSLPAASTALVTHTLEQPDHHSDLTRQRQRRNHP
jgi:hypothetical protein